MKQFSRWAVAVMLLGSLAGCSGAVAGSGERASEEPARTAPSEPAATSTEASPAAPSQTASGQSGAPEAKDGGNLAACRDGNCEVRVSPQDEINFAGAGDVGTLSVDRVGDGMVALSAGSASGGYLNTTSSVGGRIQLNQLHIVVLAVRGEVAVLRFSS